MFLRLFTAILISIFTFAASAKPKVRKPAQIDPSTRVIVVVQKNAQVVQWFSAFPPGSKIVRQYHPFYVVQLLKPVTPALLQKVRANPFVRRAIPDTKVQAGGKRKFGGECIQAAQSNNIQDIMDLIDQSGTDCDLAFSCSADGDPAMQAQLAVGGDLMLEELKRMGLSGGHTKVAVVDSGFNPGLSEYLSRPPKWFGDPDSPDVEMNEGVYQHGTPVAGLIGAKNGVGLAPTADLGIFQIPMDEQGFGNSGDAVAQIKAACDAGYKIINVSMEGLATDRDLPEIVSDLGDKGCLVVNSNGNEPGHGIFGTNKEDAWLRVGGKNVETGENKPLELGEVDAPGFGIATLDGKTEGQCGGQPLQPINGTSFAAPIVAAILTNVRGVLAKDSAFNELLDKGQGKEQIKLLNAIIAQSTRGGTVNGLRAVALAEAWTKAAVKPVDPQGVGDLLRNPPPAVCSKPPKSTDLESLGCSDRKASLNAVRARAALCTPINEQEVRDVSNALAKLDEPGIGKNLSLYLGEAGEKLRDKIGASELAANATILRQQEVERAEAVREVNEQIALQSSLSPESLGTAPLKEWQAQVSAQQQTLLASKSQTQTRLALLEKNPGANSAQITSLKGRLASIDRSLACYAGWRETFSGVNGSSTPAAQLHELVRTAKQKTGCEEPVQYFPGPYQGLAEHAAGGGAFDSYWSNHQTELQELRERYSEMTESE